MIVPWSCKTQSWCITPCDNLYSVITRWWWILSNRMVMHNRIFSMSMTWGHKVETARFWSFDCERNNSDCYDPRFDCSGKIQEKYSIGVLFGIEVTQISSWSTDCHRSTTSYVMMRNLFCFCLPLPGSLPVRVRWSSFVVIAAAVNKNIHPQLGFT